MRNTVYFNVATKETIKHKQQNEIQVTQFVSLVAYSTSASAVPTRCFKTPSIILSIQLNASPITQSYITPHILLGLSTGLCTSFPTEYLFT